MRTKIQNSMAHLAELPSLVWLIGMLCFSICNSSATEPLVQSLLPRGGQIGSEQRVVFEGNRLKDATEIIFYSQGIEARGIEAKNSKVVNATFLISPDTDFGQHELRLRTPKGLSKLLTFWVGPFPNENENEPNSSFEEAQRTSLNCTINGVIKNEDVDYFEINATKGQRISAEIEAIRLSGVMFDPHLAILDESGFEVASSDDTELLLQDSTLSILAPRDGLYRIEVRESSYRGGDKYYYRLHLGSFPRPLVVFPAGGKKGGTYEFTFLGDPAGTFKRSLTLPESQGVLAYHHSENELLSPSPNRIRVSDFASVMEAEPNQNPKEATQSDSFLPLAFNGVIEKDGDIDYFRFNAKKNDRFYIKAHARTISSPLDPLINLYHGDGKHIRGNDDADGSPDSLITQTFPKDGEYILRITDHLGRGSPSHVYRIETQRLVSEFHVSIPRFGNRDSQSRQMLPIAQGNRVATGLNVTRKNFNGGFEILAKNLPQGVSMIAPRVPGNFNSIPLVFEATKDAPLSASLVDLTLLHKDVEKNLEVEGSFKHRVELVYGPPNNTPYYETEIKSLAMAVVEPVPFKINLHQPAMPLVKGGSQNLKVEIIRDANFTSEVTIKILSKPPGIGARGSIKIPAVKSYGYYPLTANGGAALGSWKIGVLGESSAKGGGQMIAASNLIDLKVEEPYLSLKINMTAIERGKEGDVVCDLSIKRPFEGVGKLEIKGLPPFSTSKAVEFDSDTKQVSFPIKVESKAKAGLTKNLFCFAKVPLQENLITHTVGQGGQIRLDNPSLQATPQKPEGRGSKKGELSKNSRLSRLEKLRLEAKTATN